MKELEEIQKEFEAIQNDTIQSKDQKSLKYAGLMTKLEQKYNIPLLQKDTTNVDKEVMELYKKISNARIL